MSTSYYCYFICNPTNAEEYDKTSAQHDDAVDTYSHWCPTLADCLSYVSLFFPDTDLVDAHHSAITLQILQQIFIVAMVVKRYYYINKIIMKY